MQTTLNIIKGTRCARVRRRAVAALVFSVALYACAGTSSQDSEDPGYVFRSGDSYVRLVPIEPGAAANSHPFAISADRLSRLMAGINVSGADSIGKAPVFSKEELETIVPPLASALSKVGPNRDVTFAVTSYRGIFGAASPKSVTTGRLFVSGDSVNLIFGLMQERFREGDFAYTVPTTTPGMRSRRIDATGWKIESGGAHFHEQRGDWLEFDRGAIPAAAPAVPDVGTKSGGEAPPPPTIDRKAREIEDRLRLLDRLKEKDAITEQEYLERRRAILSEL
ncbi:MAG TPA: SHOCT domain-containing protein [Burkholderiales bacterium]